MTVDVESLIAATLNMSRTAVTDGLSYRGIPQWDSVGHLNLMLALEDALGAPVSDDDVVALTSVAAIRDYVRRIEPREGRSRP